MQQEASAAVESAGRETGAGWLAAQPKWLKTAATRARVQAAPTAEAWAAASVAAAEQRLPWRRQHKQMARRTFKGRSQPPSSNNDSRCVSFGEGERSVAGGNLLRDEGGRRAMVRPPGTLTLKTMVRLEHRAMVRSSGTSTLKATVRSDLPPPSLVVCCLASALACLVRIPPHSNRPSFSGCIHALLGGWLHCVCAFCHRSTLPVRSFLLAFRPCRAAP